MTMRGREASKYKILIAKVVHLEKDFYPCFSDFVTSNLSIMHKFIVFDEIESLRLGIRKVKTTGLLLTYSKFCDYLRKSEWDKVRDYKSLTKAVKSLDVDLEGIRLAFLIDKTQLLFENELYLLGHSGYEQYLNFLKHEQCRISIEEDIDYNSPNYYGKYTVNSQKYRQSYIEDYSLKIKELGCWKEEYSSLKHVRLKEILKVAEVFEPVKNEIIETFGKGRLPNTRVLEVYELLHTKAYTLDEEYRHFLVGVTTKEKIGIMKGILSVLFETKSIKKRDILEIEIF